MTWLPRHKTGLVERLRVEGRYEEADQIRKHQKVWGNQAAHASVAGVLPGPRFWGDIVDACELLVDHRVDNPLYDPGRGTRLPQRCRLAVCVDHVAIYPHESGTAPHFLALPDYPYSCLVQQRTFDKLEAEEQQRAKGENGMSTCALYQ